MGTAILGAMVRTFLLLGFLASQLAGGQLACCRPPDQVVNSPIPPLREPVQRKSARPVAKPPLEQGILFPIPPAKSSVVKPRAEVAADEPARGPEDYTEPTEIWNSPDMAARRENT